MSTTAIWTATLTLSGDDTGTKVYTAAANTNSCSYDQFVNLSISNNTIAVPPAGTTTRLTIIPPANNTNLITLKGNNADVGLPLHLTDPTSISLDTSATQVILSAAGSITGVRLQWS